MTPSRQANFRFSLGGLISDDHDRAIEDELKRSLKLSVETLVYTLLDSVAVLPAERKSLSSFRFPDRPSFVEHETVQSPSPIHDFQYMLESASGRMASSTGEGTFRAMTKVLENEILQGNIHWEDERRPQGRADGKPSAMEPRTAPSSEGTLSYATNEGVELPMYASASIVRALAGLDLYLKVFCKRDGFLVIDEPEMNAHPEAQLKIIEFIALLVRHGVRVVFTTHSPYIVDHLSNLMQASQLGEKAKKNVAPLFKLASSEAFLSCLLMSRFISSKSPVKWRTFLTENKESSI